MREEAKQFLRTISGSAPVDLSKKDDISWGKEGYTVKSGYKQLLEDNGIPPKSTVWKEIWNPNNLPKINIFCWQFNRGQFEQKRLSGPVQVCSVR